MSEDPYDPNPQVEISQSELNPVSPEDPGALMIASDGVPLLEVAIPQQQANRDQEREASVEGDDVELPEPVIELIDDDLPGTQPCSRRAAEPKKRTRSRSPSRAREASVQRQVPTTRPPLDQRIQLELGLHTAGESSNITK